VSRILTELGWRNVMCDPKPPRRVKATLAEWKQIRANKMSALDACRVCQSSGPLTLHHLVSKSLGGDDLADNLVAVCGSGTTGCHGLIEAFDPWACSLLGQRLTDAERAYVVARKGAYFLESRYGLKGAAA
jgi:hypothetical protein